MLLFLSLIIKDDEKLGAHKFLVRKIWGCNFIIFLSRFFLIWCSAAPKNYEKIITRSKDLYHLVDLLYDGISQYCPQLSIMTGFIVLPDLDPTASICRMIDKPSSTSPNTTCLPSNQGVASVQIKN